MKDGVVENDGKMILADIPNDKMMNSDTGYKTFQSAPS